ncbi:MAG: sigma-70 family RNA polymerase sigma factor [Bryobacteraceae bacterium]
MAGQPEISRLLHLWSEGDQSALEDLIPIVYAELRRIGRRYMRAERPGHTLQTTALVNEAYLRLVDQRGKRFENRAHFFAIAAQSMRQILVDHARKQKRLKRGGGCHPLDLEEAALISPQRSEEILALHQALDRLGSFDPRKSKVVEMRYFGGLSVEETAHVLQVSPNTVIRDWSLAKAWLSRELEPGTAP